MAPLAGLGDVDALIQQQWGQGQEKNEPHGYGLAHSTPWKANSFHYFAP